MAEDVIDFTIPNHGMENDERLEHNGGIWLSETIAKSSAHILEGAISREGGGNDGINVLWLDATGLWLGGTFHHLVIAARRNREVHDRVFEEKRNGPSECCAITSRDRRTADNLLRDSPGHGGWGDVADGDCLLQEALKVARLLGISQGSRTDRALACVA